MKIKTIIAGSVAAVTVGTITVLGATGVLTPNTDNDTSSAESSEVSIVSYTETSVEPTIEIVSSEPTSTVAESSEATSSIIETSNELDSSDPMVVSEYYVDGNLFTVREPLVSTPPNVYGDSESSEPESSEPSSTVSSETVSSAVE